MVYIKYHTFFSCEHKLYIRLIILTLIIMIDSNILIELLFVELL